MTNVTTTNLDPRTVALGPVDGVDALVAFSGEDTYAKGTLLGRLVTSATSYVGTITGTGTRVATLVARAGKSMKVGAYSIVAGTLTSGVGTWTMTDPDGQTATYTTVAAGGDLSFPALGVDVTIADTGTNYVTADSVAFTVAAPTGKPVYAPFVATGSNGLQNPSAVLLDALSATEASNVLARPVVRGDVNRNLLVIDAGGSITEDIVEKLRTNGIFAHSTKELASYDNTAPTP
jgi:hypothetical protein